MRATRTVVKIAAEAVDAIRPPRPGLVVLLYHRVGARTDVSVDLPTELFDDQMARIAESGRAVSLDEAVMGLRAGIDLTGRVVVTFDDGTADFVDVAVPVLVRHRVPVTLYVATRFVDEQRPFPDDGRPASWSALAEARSTGMVTIGSHTHSHALLDRLADHAVADELDRSIDLIGDRLGSTVDHFAFPKALEPTPAAELAVRSRFRSAAVARTRANPPGGDPYRITRSPIQINDGMRWFERKLGGGMALEDDVRSVLARARHLGATT